MSRVKDLCIGRVGAGKCLALGQGRIQAVRLGGWFQ